MLDLYYKIPLDQAPQTGDPRVAYSLKEVSISTSFNAAPKHLLDQENLEI